MITIIANWKMNMLTVKEVEAYMKELIVARNRARIGDNILVVICPSAPHYHVVAEYARLHKWLTVGAQNIFWERSGAYTGEISTITARDVGVNYVLVGHSECRQIGRVTDEEIAQKMIAAIHARLTPVLLVGETQAQHDAGKFSDVLKSQLTTALANIDEHNIVKCIIGYEPIWAIGTGRVPTTDEIVAARIVIRRILVQLYGNDIALKVAIAYGGSVNDTNAQEIIRGGGMEGLVIGGASQDPAHLVRIMSLCE
jgi:triosephosphate isomerase